MTVQNQVDWYAGKRVPSEQVELTELTKDYRELLLEFAGFCERSGSFAQW
jgi:hypothetical protein